MPLLRTGYHRDNSPFQMHDFAAHAAQKQAALILGRHAAQPLRELTLLLCLILCYQRGQLDEIPEWIVTKEARTPGNRLCL
ncbi:hypothetical protein KTH_01090 [Thermosporothrix hazakensis]|nr:hypothetical protein KTH_01090 [Thermosporothrix hazakensis]